MSTDLQAIIVTSEPPPADADSFVVGQDRHGHWVAVEVHGRAGGLFRSRQAAIHFAANETDHRLDAVLLSGMPVELRI